jgi:hypothetical protein
MKSSNTLKPNKNTASGKEKMEMEVSESVENSSIGGDRGIQT